MKKYFLKLLKLYTENEVRNLFSELQYETAQEIIGNRAKVVTPLEFFEEKKK